MAAKTVREPFSWLLLKGLLEDGVLEMSVIDRLGVQGYASPLVPTRRRVALPKRRILMQDLH